MALIVRGSKAIYALVVVLAVMLGWWWLDGGILPDSDQSAAAGEYRFEPGKCFFRIPAEEQITCGRLLTPASSGAFSLPVVILHDTSAQRRDDPLLYLQGGPGAASGMQGDALRYWLGWRDRLAAGRDLVFMDPRGTGGSLPALTCTAFDRLSLRILKDNVDIAGEYRQGDETMAACFQQARGKGFDPAFYGTRQSARDIQGLIESLPQYRQWNLYGVSYGSRLAIMAALDYPAIKTLVLDSVYPPGRGRLEDWPALLQQSISRFGDWCDNNPGCRQEHPQLFMSRLLAVLQQLQAHPVDLIVDRWDGEWPVALVLNDHRFLSFVFYSLYDASSWLDLVGAMTLIEESGGSYRRELRQQLGQLMQSLVNQSISPDFSAMVFDAVDCQDQGEFQPGVYRQQVADNPELAAYTRGLEDFQNCNGWSNTPDAALNADAIPRQPGLLLSGDLDPITPPEWAAELHQQWPESEWLLFADTGHAVISSHTCVMSAIALYLDNPEAGFQGCKAEGVIKNR